VEEPDEEEPDEEEPEKRETGECSVTESKEEQRSPEPEQTISTSILKRIQSDLAAQKIVQVAQQKVQAAQQKAIRDL
jgi:hypothetical protein